MIEAGNFTRVPWIAGVNSEEGLIIGAAVMANQTLQDMAEDDWSEFIRKLLVFTKNDAIAEKIRNFYFGDCTTQKCKESFTENLTRYTRMISDRGFFVDFHHGAQLHTSFTPVYLYYYSYPGEWSVANLFMEVRGTLPRLMEAGWAIISHWVKKSIFGGSLPHYGNSYLDIDYYWLVTFHELTKRSNSNEFQVPLILMSWLCFLKCHGFRMSL